MKTTRRFSLYYYLPEYIRHRMYAQLTRNHHKVKCFLLCDQDFSKKKLILTINEIESL